MVILRLLLCLLILSPILNAVDSADKLQSIPIEFTGMHDFSARELRQAARQELAQFENNPRESYLFDANYSMLQHMRNKGYYFARISYTWIPNKNDPQTVLFTVSEKNPVMIKNIKISGAQAWENWSDDDIRNTIGSPIKGLMKHFGVGELIFRNRDVDNAINSIMTAYLLHGYQEVEVGPAELIWNDDQTEVTIMIPVKEGPHYTFRKAEVRSDTEGSNISASMLRRSYSMLTLDNKDFHPRQLRQQLGDIRRFLNDHGYLAASVNGSYAFVPNTHQVDATITIKPGPQYIFNDLILKGDPYTRKGLFRYYTRRLINSKYIPYYRIDESIGYLYRTGIFESLRWKKVVRSHNTDNTVNADIVIDVKELPRRSLDFSLGYGSYEQARGAVTYGNHNLFGIGLDGELEYRLSMKSQAVEGSLFIGEYYRKQFLILQSGWEEREEPSFDSETYDAQLRYRQLHGNDQLFGVDVKDKLEALFGYNFERSQATNVVQGADVNEDEIILVSSLEFAETIELRDDLFNPTRGARLRANVEWASPVIGSDLHFLRYEGQIQFYIPLDEDGDWVLAHNFRVNTYELLGDTDELPIQKRLFLGGENSVRSFKRHHLGPTNSDGDPIGGLSSALASVEARFPLVPAYNLSGAVFWDAGLIDTEEKDFDADIGQAVGVGIRFDLPIGPIRLDAATNVGEEFATDEDFVLHFALGFSF